MQFSLRLAMVSFWLTILLFLSNALISQWNTRRLICNEHLVDQAQSLLTILDEAFASTADAETEERGLVSTGSHEDLRRYLEALQLVQDQLEALLESQTGDLERLRRVAHLQRQVAVVVDRTRQALGARETVSDLKSGAPESKQLLTDIRALITELRENQQSILDRRTKESRRSIYTKSIAELLGTCLGIAAASVAFYFFRRDSLNRKKVADRLAQLNQTLKQQLADGTELAESQAMQLRELATDLTRAEQRERQRISALLHDHIQQLLVAAKMHLSFCETSPDKAEQQLHHLLDEAISALRSLAVELNPPVLRSVGLSKALQSLAQTMERQFHLHVRLSISSAVEPSDYHARVLIYGILRELLFNVAKHAGVSEASITMSASPGLIDIEVSDQGKGFDPNEAVESDSAGMGLASIRQRVELLGGHLRLQTAPGCGTSIKLRVPIDRELDMSTGSSRH